MCAWEQWPTDRNWSVQEQQVSVLSDIEMLAPVPFIKYFTFTLFFGWSVHIIISEALKILFPKVFRPIPCVIIQPKLFVLYTRYTFNKVVSDDMSFSHMLTHTVHTHAHTLIDIMCVHSIIEKPSNCKYSSNQAKMVKSYNHNAISIILIAHTHTHKTTK